MSQEPGDIEAAEKLTKAFNELSELILLLRRDQQNSSTNTQNININAGGWGILIALVMFAFLAGLNISLAANQVRMGSDISDIRRRNDLANDKLSVILQWAPELAKKVDQSVHEKEKSK